MEYSFKSNLIYKAQKYIYSHLIQILSAGQILVKFGREIYFDGDRFWPCTQTLPSSTCLWPNILNWLKPNGCCGRIRNRYEWLGSRNVLQNGILPFVHSYLKDALTPNAGVCEPDTAKRELIWFHGSWYNTMAISTLSLGAFRYIFFLNIIIMS
jgi:hypothetical protein